MKQKILYVMPECYVDTNLIEYLLNASVNHQHSCSKVVAQLNTTFSEKFAIGIIDKDKVELGYVKECRTIAESKHITLLKHQSKSQYLIMVAPAIDGFIIDCAKEQNVNMMNFGLPAALQDFIKISKNVTSNKDPRFKNLFAAIKDNVEIKTLKNTLKHPCQQQYHTDEELIKRYFQTDNEV